MDKDYLFFWGHTQKDPDVIDKSCLSQWYPSPFSDKNFQYATAEHYMMAQKAILFEDFHILRKILDNPNPQDAKNYGRQVKGFDERIWDKFKCHFVITGNYNKFFTHKDLMNFLIETGTKHLVEASPWDNVWGIGYRKEDAMKFRGNWGENLLGQCLMITRNYLR